MKLYVVRDSAFTLSGGEPASNVITYDGYSNRFVPYFDEIAIIGRLFHRNDPKASPVTGPSVSFVAMPGYHGPIGFAKALPAIIKTMFSTTKPGACYILRVPATIPSLFGIILKLKGIPFAVEVAGDPRDGYSRTALNGNPLSAVFQKLFISVTKWLCKHAAATGYVTSHTLQERYPPGNKAATFAFTSIDLHSTSYADAPRPAASFSSDVLKVVLVGNMQKSFKGHDVLLEALGKLSKKGVKTHVVFIGDGENLDRYKAQAEQLGVSADFKGRVENGPKLRDLLDEADMFVLPSRQEGLPRALLEAMARGLPAIATRVGGTPELLDDAYIVPPEDPDQLAAKIEELSADKAHMAQCSKTNLEKARRYSAEIVQAERGKFYTAIKSASKKPETP